MRILWDAAELKPREILERHPRAISDSTLRSFLAELVKKGHVARVRRGKVYYYEARTRPESAFRHRLAQLIEVFCGGSLAALARRLVECETLSAKELAELQALVEERRLKRRGGKETRS